MGRIFLSRIFPFFKRGPAFDMMGYIEGYGQWDNRGVGIENYLLGV